MHQQNSILAEVAATNPAGIAIDPLDAIVNLPAMTAAHDHGISVVVFDSPWSDPAFSSIGNDFVEQGTLAARRLINLIEETGEVALMQGFPSAPNHRQRYEAQLDLLRKHPGVVIVDGGIGNDDIPTAGQQAAAALASHPNLKGYLCCDASGPIGIATAIREADKIGEVKVVGMDGIEPILNAIKGRRARFVGRHDSQHASVYGFADVVAGVAGNAPQKIDTGIDFITTDNVDAFLAAYARTHN